MSNLSSIYRSPAALIRVNIQNQDGLKAVLTPEQVVVEKGVPVRWWFTNVPPGYQPLLRFTSPPSTDATFDTGPFEFLCQRNHQILGLGSSCEMEEEEAEHCYEVMLVPMDEKCPPLCPEQTASLIILPPPADDRTPP